VAIRPRSWLAGWQWWVFWVHGDNQLESGLPPSSCRATRYPTRLAANPLGIAEGAIPISNPHRHEIEKFATESFAVARDRILNEHAEKQTSVLAQVRRTGNSGAYLPALIRCEAEKVREVGVGSPRRAHVASIARHLRRSNVIGVSTGEAEDIPLFFTLIPVLALLSNYDRANCLINLGKATGNRRQSHPFSRRAISLAAGRGKVALGERGGRPAPVARSGTVTNVGSSDPFRVA
jgi:hypothetical protein